MYVFFEVSVNFLIAVLTVSACIFGSYLMYLPQFDPWGIYLALYVLFCRHYFIIRSYKWLIKLDLHSITLL